MITWFIELVNQPSCLAPAHVIDGLTKRWYNQPPLAPLLPLAPVLHGGSEPKALQRALTVLRADETLSELEPLLAFFASFFLDTQLVQQIMRWDMAVLRESPWYAEILAEGRHEGLELGRHEGIELGRHEMALQQLIGILTHRFGSVSE